MINNINISLITAILSVVLGMFSTAANAQNIPQEKTLDEQADEVAKAVIKQANADWEAESLKNAQTDLNRGDYTTAFPIIRELAKAGNVIAQYDTGFMYFKGQGIAQNYGEAAKWLRKAAEHGNGQASMILGFLYLQGQGVQQDYKESIKWYRKAADQGEDVPRSLLGSTTYPCPHCSPKKYDAAQQEEEYQLEKQRQEEEMDEMHGDLVIQQMEQQQRVETLEQQEQRNQNQQQQNMETLQQQIQQQQQQIDNHHNDRF